MKKSEAIDILLDKHIGYIPISVRKQIANMLENPKEKIINALPNEVGPVFIVSAEILNDGFLSFVYTFSEDLAKRQRKKRTDGLIDGVYDELIEPSSEMYKEAAHYIIMRKRSYSRKPEGDENDG